MTPTLQMVSLLLTFLAGGGFQWWLAGARRREIDSLTALNTAQSKEVGLKSLMGIIDKLNIQRGVDETQMERLKERVVILEEQLRSTITQLVRLQQAIDNYKAQLENKDQQITALREDSKCVTQTS